MSKNGSNQEKEQTKILGIWGITTAPNAIDFIRNNFEVKGAKPRRFHLKCELIKLWYPRISTCDIQLQIDPLANDCLITFEVKRAKPRRFHLKVTFWKFFKRMNTKLDFIKFTS